MYLFSNLEASRITHDLFTKLNKSSINIAKYQKVVLLKSLKSGYIVSK